MSTVAKSGNYKDSDAPKALFCLFLGLQKSDIRESTNERNNRKKCEEAAQPFASCSNVARSNSAKKYNVRKVSMTKRKTRDVAIQTVEKSQLPIIKAKELTISQLQKKIKSLEEQRKANSQPVETIDQGVSGNNNDDDSESCMVPIGNGNALIPSRIFKTVNWTSYTCATRKLLMAVFTRSILATHSLTGKPSPAFPNKPAKKKLDPALVSDIVQTVAERCCVSDKLVRTVITTKCADESKMFRIREKNIKKAKRKVNENIPPESDSD